MQLGVLSGDIPQCALASFFFFLVTVDNCEGLHWVVENGLTASASSWTSCTATIKEKKKPSMTSPTTESKLCNNYEKFNSKQRHSSLQSRAECLIGFDWESGSSNYTDTDKLRQGTNHCKFCRVPFIFMHTPEIFQRMRNYLTQGMKSEDTRKNPQEEDPAQAKRSQKLF